MIWLMISFMMLAALTVSVAKADIGLGFVLGQPTGFSGKFSTSRNHAIDMAIAWDLDDDYEHVHLHGDYLWLRNNDIRLDNVALDWFFGIGGRVRIFDRDYRHRHDDDYSVGARFPIGIGYTFKDPRIEVFGELALIVDILESTDADIDGGIGARYHF